MAVLSPTTTAPALSGMTFLEICNQLAELASIPGTISTVTGQTGENLRVVRWAKQAWIDIQNKNTYWKFLRRSLSFTTTTSQAKYTLAQMGTDDLNELDLDSMRVYQTSVGLPSENFLVNWEYDDWRDVYDFGTPQQDGQPVIFAVDPTDKGVVVGPAPSPTGYTIRGRYWRSPVSLSADTDVPACPAQFHMAIVYRALIKYAGYEAAPEVKQTAIEEYKQLMQGLWRDQGGTLRFGESLA